MNSVMRLIRRFRVWLDWDVLDKAADWGISRKLGMDGWLATWAIVIGDINGDVARAIEYSKRPDAKYYTLDEFKQRLEAD